MLKTCPSPHQLRRLLADQLAAAQENPIGDHVEKCPFCQESLERLTHVRAPSEPRGSGCDDAALALDVDRDFLRALKSDPPEGVLRPRGSSGIDPVEASPASGEHVCDNLAPEGFEILAELGRGGMGVVYKARQHKLNRSVALKMISSGARASPSEHERFRREAETIARLPHPNIVQIYEVGEHRGCPYLTLELVEGESLARHIDGSPQPARHSAELIETLARAIHAAHRLGIIHRDLKPANVLLNSSGEPKITDFGLAKRFDGEVLFPTLTEQVLGTPSYMAPEQALRERVPASSSDRECAAAAAVDVYSLGAILYEMLTGRPPFRSDSALETVLQVIHQEPIRPSQLRPEVPRDLETICLKCLEKSPTRRYGTALELAEDLHRFLHFEPVKARPIAAPGRIWRWCRRKTSLAIAVALAAVAIASTIGLSISLAVHQYHSASRLSEALLEVESQRLQVEKQASHLAYEHGQSLCEQGDLAHGMLWLVRGLKSAHLAHDADLERAFRLNLAGWWPRIHRLRVRCEYPGQIEAVAYSPDGRTIAVAGDDNTVQLHDTTTGELDGAPLVHPAKVGAVAFSDSGRILVTGCDDNLARLWDLKTRAMIGPEFRHQQPVLGVAISPDGQMVLTGSADTTARLWNASDGRPIGQPMCHQKLVNSVAFAPDGRTVLTGSWDKTARLWDAATGTSIGEPLLHPDWVSSVAFGPDGQTLLTGCYDRTARLWDRRTGRPIGRPLRHLHCVRAVAFGPGGKMVVTGSFDGSVRIWDTATGEPLGPPLCHRHSVSAVAFSPDGRSLVSAGFDKTALICDVGRSFGLSFAHDGFIRAVLFSPDGQTILTASEDKTAKLWTTATGKPKGTPLIHGASVEAIAFSPDGRRVLTGSYDNTARIWDAATGLPAGPTLRHEGPVKTVAFSPNGETVATGGGDMTARLWNAATGELLGTPLRHLGWVDAVAFSPDGSLVATGSDDKTARLWDASCGKPKSSLLGHGGGVKAVAFSPDGRTLVTGSLDMKARLWDTASGKLRVPPLPHDGPVTVAKFSPDGNTVITGGWDRVARLWDATTGLTITPPLRHEGALRALAVSRDGRTVLTGSYDRTAQLWDKATGKPIGPAFRHENQVWFVAFSPDGRTVLSGGQEKQAHLWNVPPSMTEPITEIERSIQVATGMEILDDGSLHILDHSEWIDRRAHATLSPSVAAINNNGYAQTIPRNRRDPNR